MWKNYSHILSIKAYICLPHNYTILNFNKYRGRGSPIEHVKELHTACIDIAFEHTYLMILFPSSSLVGKALEWFSNLPLRIQTWSGLVDNFVTHFSYNIENNIILATLCQDQKEGETFIYFFQGWRSMDRKCPCQISKKIVGTHVRQKLNHIIETPTTNPLLYRICWPCWERYYHLENTYF